MASGTPSTAACVMSTLPGCCSLTTLTVPAWYSGSPDYARTVLGVFLYIHIHHAQSFL